MAPNATEIFLIGDFSDWKERPAYRFKPLSNGVWEIKLDAEQLHHLDLYKLSMHWEGGQGERVPAWATRVVQDETTKIFSAQVWYPEKPYTFKKKKFTPNTSPLLIYECHIGMAQEDERIGSYDEFREKVLPALSPTDIMPYRSWPYRNTPTTGRSVTMYRASSPPLHASALPMS